MRNHQHSVARAFTLMETLVVLGILVVLLSIFIPYLLSIRETNRRAACEKNLTIIFWAMQAYARDNRGVYPRVVYEPAARADGYVAFTGPDDPNPFSLGSAVKPSDVTASLWLLARIGYIVDTRVFVCPSSGGARDPLVDAAGAPVAASQRGNFRSYRNLTYSYANPFSSAPEYRLNDTKPGDFVLMADLSPGEPAAAVSRNASSLELARGNSPNHGGTGQLVLRSQGYVKFEKSPYCGLGGDNIYTARSRSVRLATQPSTLPTDVPGVVGLQYSPVANDDSYLVPSVTDYPAIESMLTLIPLKPATRATTTTTQATTGLSAPVASTTVGVQ